MRRISAFLLFVSLASAGGASGQSPLSGLDRPQSFIPQRASSSAAAWQTDNTDFVEVLPGKTTTIMNASGPGRIAHMWFTLAAPERSYSRRVTLRIYFDGETDPSVEAPLGDFFGVGHGMDVEVNSLPVRVTANGRARNCYWPMPFRKSVRVEITNDGLSPIRRLYWQIDWQRLPSLPADTPYFHARYRQQDRLQPGRYVVLDAEGKGHYVGTVMSVRARSGGWFGEGDDFFFVDGEKEPSLRGTGTEDYVGDAWEFRQFDGPYYGVPIYEGNGTDTLTSYYRWHVVDPIPFEKSLRFEIEHTGPPAGSATGAYVERPDDFASVAFWYQVEPHKPFGAVPAVEQRLPYSLADAQELTMESVRLAQGGTPSLVRRSVALAAQGPGALLEVEFEVKKPGRFDLVAYLPQGPDSGTYQVALDGEASGAPRVFFSPAAVMPAGRILGSFTFTPGRHRLRFTCIGKAPASRGYDMAVGPVILAPSTGGR
jgi:hypothetical protein